MEKLVRESVPDWSALQSEMLESIARCCTVMEDFMAFRGVCTSWRAAAAKNVFVSVSKVPLLMLAEKDGTDEREFYSLAKRKMCTRIPLPDLVGKRCTDVGFGWVLTRDSNGEVWLMKPFSSSARIQLPNFKQFPGYPEVKVNPEDVFIRRAWLTANPSETLQFTLVVDGFKHLGFWRSGDKSWTKKETMWYSALTFFKGRIYVLDLEGQLLVWDSQDFSKPPGLAARVKNAPTLIPIYFKDYLVGSSDGDQLLVIRRNNFAGKAYHNTGADHFDVFTVDLARGELIEMNGLGKDAVFIGENAPVCVDASEFPEVLKPNCIYFTDDCVGTYVFSYLNTKEESCIGGGKDMGIYDVGDESIQRFDVGHSLSLTCPPMWIFPSF